MIVKGVDRPFIIYKALPVFQAMVFILIWDKERVTRYTFNLAAYITNYVNKNLLIIPDETQANADPR